METNIEHEGTVISKDGQMIKVLITSLSGCASCHSKAACSMADKKEKIIEIRGKYDVSEGDTVTVVMSKNLGYPAVFIGYVLPLLIVLVSLIVLIALSVPETTAGLISIGILAPYFFILHLFKSHIDKKFTFTIK